MRREAPTIQSTDPKPGGGAEWFAETVACLFDCF